MLKHVIQLAGTALLLFALLGWIGMVSPPSVAHAAAFHAANPAGCTDTITFRGYDTDSTNVYEVVLEVHKITGAVPECLGYYARTEAFVAQGHSFNIRVCAGQSPEKSHNHEVCHDYSGSAPLHGWYSPYFNSYTWGTLGCDGYADIIGHIGLASNVGCTF